MYDAHGIYLRSRKILHAGAAALAHNARALKSPQAHNARIIDACEEEGILPWGIRACFDQEKA